MIVSIITLTLLAAVTLGPNRAGRAQTAAASGPLAFSVRLDGRVTDAADILSARQEKLLAAKLARFERDTQHQMVIVTVPTLNGHDDANVARDFGNRWAIGRKEFDDGIVLLVAPNDRRVRIAVGLGLENVLTDELCGKILDDIVLPRFEDGDLFGGIYAGVDAIIWELRSRPSSH